MRGKPLRRPNATPKKTLVCMVSHFRIKIKKWLLLRNAGAKGPAAIT